MTTDHAADSAGLNKLCSAHNYIRPLVLVLQRLLFVVVLMHIAVIPLAAVLHALMYSDNMRPIMRCHHTLVVIFGHLSLCHSLPLMCSCIKGSLLEVNEQLLANPSLLKSKVTCTVG